MKVKKIISYVIDALLVSIIGILGYVQISMLVTRDKNYGVPSAFNRSFLYVATDSMANPDDKKSLVPGTGIIIEKVKDVNSLKLSTPVFDEENDPNHEQDPIDFLRDGSIVTFYLESKDVPDTHRLIDKFYDENGNLMLQTMGDNPIAHERHITETWNAKLLIGKVVYSSKALGSFLSIASPSAAASAGKSAWFFPVAILAPVMGLSIYYIASAVIKYSKENKLRDQQIEESLRNSGVDLNDEEAVELFKMKEEMKLEYKDEYEKMKKRIRKEIEKEKEKLRNEKK